jgi:hypothetical protein
MYNIEKKECFYVLDRDNNHYEFETYEKLLRWLDRHRIIYIFWRKKKQGKIDSVGNSWNELREVVQYNFSPQYPILVKEPIKFIVFDAHNRIINLEYLLEDLEKLPEKEFSLYDWRDRRIARKRLIFRAGPVPYTGYGNKASKYHYRHPKTTQEKRRNCWDKYARAKRCKISNVWDDPSYRKRERSWKRQKKRKQWL